MSEVHFPLLSISRTWTLITAVYGSFICASVSSSLKVYNGAIESCEVDVLLELGACLSFGARNSKKRKNQKTVKK